VSDRYVQALALGLDPEWRRLPPDERRSTFSQFALALEAGEAVKTFTYSTIGLKAGVDLLVWRLGASFEALEEAAAAMLRSGAGTWMEIRHSFVGVIQQSQYVKRPTPQEQSLFSGERSRYLVVYPFTKSSDWYLLDVEARQKVMNEHMRVGHQYPQVRQLLANSFGVDDQDFLVAYETDDLALFSELVRALRSTESRRSTVRDTPILVGVHREPRELAVLLGA
jgi:chlorite dismutase